MEKTKIILVNPPLTGKERYGALAGGGLYMPPLGIASLAAFIRREGHSVKILDCCALGLTITQAAQIILSLKPEFVGITSATLSINKAAVLAKALKGSNPDLKIIIGGVHVSSLPEETMNLFPQFDIGVLGEGERAVAELLKCSKDNYKPDGINGLIVRENNGLKLTGAQTFIEDLDSLPFPAWDLLPDLKKFYRPSSIGFKKLPAITVITSRGCPMRCTFCSGTAFAKAYRAHSPEYVVSMVKALKTQFGIKELMIVDGAFLMNPRRVVNLCELMIKEKLDLSWSCSARIDVMRPEILRLMKKAGCWSIAYGIESGSQRVLDFIEKEIDLAKAPAVIKWTKEAGILAKGYFMLGHLTEDRVSIRDTRDFILKNRFDLITVGYFTPLPGSTDYERAPHYGKFNNNWDLLNLQTRVFLPRNLEAGTINSYRRKILREFYLRPKIFFRYSRLVFERGYFKIIFMGFISLLGSIFFDKPAHGPEN
ncbi:MAG: radical SAM protein [Candidatus Omnitrophica bacterium]|nr:radical SAM protein [Candidatus Omnitrophota bacterium]